MCENYFQNFFISLFFFNVYLFELDELKNLKGEYLNFESFKMLAQLLLKLELILENILNSLRDGLEKFSTENSVG